MNANAFSDRTLARALMSTVSNFLKLPPASSTEQKREERRSFVTSVIGRSAARRASDETRLLSSRGNYVLIRVIVPRRKVYR